MTPADEATFIELWNQGLELAEMAQRLGIPRGTVSSRATPLRKRGVALAKRPQGGLILGAKPWRGRREHPHRCRDQCITPCRLLHPCTNRCIRRPTTRPCRQTSQVS
jgi:hypothetical protein